MKSVLLQFLLSAFGTLVCLGVLRARTLPWLGLMRMGLIAVAVRLGFLFLVFGLFGFPFFMDMPGYLEQAGRVLGGEVPNGDFLTPYGPLFVVLSALCLWLTGSAWGLVVTLQVAELGGLLLILRALRDQVEESTRHKFFYLYLFNPISLNSLCLLTQDECLMILALGICLTLVTPSSRPGSILWTLPCFFATKLFTVWMLIPLWFRVDRRRQRLMSLGFSAAFIGLMVVGIRPVSTTFSRLGSSGDHLVERMTNGNIWFWVTLFPLDAGIWPKVITLIALAVALMHVVGQRSKGSPAEFILWGTALFTLTFQLTYQMSYPMYLAPALPGMVLLLLQSPGTRNQVAILGTCFLAAFLSPAYFRIWLQADSPIVYRGLFLMGEAMLLGCLGMTWWRCWTLEQR